MSAPPQSAPSPANPLRASYYADQAGQWTVKVVENVQLARDTFRVRLSCPELAQRITPGQFVMLRLPGVNDPLLGRPFALYDTCVDDAGRRWGVDIVYLVVGKMTKLLRHAVPDDEVEIWGPLGNGFSPRPADHLIMVAGGIGQTPFLALGQERLGRKTYGDLGRKTPRSGRVTLCYGVRDASLAAGVDDFQAAGIEALLSSDDGSVGRHGLVTELLDQVLEENDRLDACRIACCGPEPMMEAVAETAQRRGVACEVSLETPMACGIGICFSCVVRVRQPGGSWDYKRTCVDGPIFDAEQIVW
ncbi:MAG: dihydroorotate dehydrogenase electron transfer subunit [Planctomycetota bacterium]